MKKILVVCPLQRDYVELARHQNIKDHQIIFHTYDLKAFRRFIYAARTGKPLDMATYTKETMRVAKKHRVDAIISNDDYIGCILASIVSYECNLPAPQPQALLTCQHKYHSRIAQQTYIPEAVPTFCAIDKSNMHDLKLPFPLFVKPTKSFFSIGAHTMHSLQELQQSIDRLIPPTPFLEPLTWCLKQYTDLNPNTDYLVAEELLEGVQTTVDGFVYNGEVTVYGIVDSVMYPGTHSFARFDYPSHLPNKIQKRMATLTKKFMQSIGFNHGMFNIEYFYNPITDHISIIEINPRMASAFADLYQKVNGVNAYSILVDIAAHQQPITVKKGNYQAASIFVLRLPDDHYVVSLPTENEIKQVKQLFPGTQIELLAQVGKKLSECLQNGQMYRYACIHIGGKDLQNLIERFEQIKKMLSFTFSPVIHKNASSLMQAGV